MLHQGALVTPAHNRPRIRLSSTPLHPQKRLFLLHSTAPHVLALAGASPSSACHCEPVRTLVWQSASPGRNAVHCCRARVRARLPDLSLRTSAHTGVAIRIPWQKRRALLPCPGARIPTKLVIANQCAHWCGNPHPPAGTWYIAPLPGCAHTYQACHCEPVRLSGVAIRIPWQKRRALLPCPGARTPTKLVIANQCA